MKTQERKTDTTQEGATDWRRTSEKQRFLIDSILSLLAKYGASLDLRMLERELLLTLMGQFTVVDACFYSTDGDAARLIPVHAYGSILRANLSPISKTSPLSDSLHDSRSPQRFESLPETVRKQDSIKGLPEKIQIVGPIFLKERLLGVVFLGKKISGQRYSELDIEVINTLCAASSATFNNARLYENTRFSMQEVQRLSDIRSEMISRMSHEFRTPLTVIKSGLSYLVESDSESPVLKMISHSVEQLHELIDSLFLLNEKYQPDPTAKRDHFSPSQQVYELVSGYSNQASSRNLSFEFKETTKIDKTTVGVPKDDFITVVESILKNAIKYSKDGSTVRIDLEVASREPDESIDGTVILDWKTQTQRTINEYGRFFEDPALEKRVDDNSLAQGNEGDVMEIPKRRYLVMRISDEGIGIPGDELEFLGEPFRQASNSPDQQVKGKALGLAVVQKILSDCRGHLCCRSKENVGSTFTVFFPLANL